MIKSNLIQNEKLVQFKVHKWALFCFFVITTLPPLRYNQTIYWSSIVLTAVILCYMILLSKVRVNGYIIWGFVVNFCILLSVLWANNIDLARSGVAGSLAVFIPYTYMSMLIKEKEDIYELLKLFIYSKVIMALYIIINVDVTTLEGIRIGVDVLGEGWNANYIGMNMAISSFILVLLIKTTKIKKIKLLYILLISLFTFLTLLSGSRKALFILIFSIGLFIIFSSKKHKVGKATIVLLLTTLTFYLVMNIPFFYDVLGVRLEGFLANFTDTGVVDGSTALRMTMIEQGLLYFYEQPVLGYGINNFQQLFASTFGYSHNNYIELLVGIGLFGTIVYYLGYTYIIKKTYNVKGNLYAFAFVSVLTIVIIDTGLVSYNAFYIQFLICISFSIISIQKKVSIPNKKGSL
ncbi:MULTISPECIES: O-antigen ligase family protein [unclassified Oceanobacillus]|uniref:O-antigen ligase family protein n=1 Tax=unclassified Oceanobacillus TaxID=2630292 RepID=UPI00300DBE60